jgi:hypothetical protein
MVDAPATQLDEEEHVQSPQREWLDREEVDREPALRLPSVACPWPDAETFVRCRGVPETCRWNRAKR